MPKHPDSVNTWIHKILYGLTNLGLLVAGLANLLAGTWAAFSNLPAISATSLAAGLVLLLAATIDRFESLKGLGIEAKTRQLDEKIDQADEALIRLREMTELTCTALIDLNCKAGRFDAAPTPREFIALADKIRSLMQSVGSPEDTIRATLESWARLLCFDMALAKTSKLHMLIESKVQQLDGERRALNQPLQIDDPHLVRISGQVRTLKDFQQSHLSSLHKLELDDFPDKFMNIFSDVPLIDEQAILPLRQDAARFASGMRSLALERKLSDRELWIETLTAAR